MMRCMCPGGRYCATVLPGEEGFPKRGGEKREKRAALRDGGR